MDARKRLCEAADLIMSAAHSERKAEGDLAGELEALAPEVRAMEGRVNNYLLPIEVRQARATLLEQAQ